MHPLSQSVSDESLILISIRCIPYPNLYPMYPNQYPMHPLSQSVADASLIPISIRWIPYPNQYPLHPLSQSISDASLILISSRCIPYPNQYPMHPLSQSVSESDASLIHIIIRCIYYPYHYPMHPLSRLWFKISTYCNRWVFNSCYAVITLRISLIKGLNIVLAGMLIPLTVISLKKETKRSELGTCDNWSRQSDTILRM